MFFKQLRDDDWKKRLGYKNIIKNLAILIILIMLLIKLG